MRIFSFGLCILLQVQNVINIKNVDMPTYENINLNKSLYNSYISPKSSGVTFVANSEKKTKGNGPMYTVYENDKEIPFLKRTKNTESSTEEESKPKFKKSIKEVVTESIEEVDEEIESYTIDNEGENNNTTLQVSSATENATDYLEVNTEDVTESLNITITTANTTLDVTTPAPKTKKSKSKKKSSSKSKSVICDCDLTKSVCDVNCCCDKDCLETDKMVFSKCIDNDKIHNGYWKSRYCTSKQFIFKNNSPWLIENHSNDLFCVLKDNLPPKLKGRAPKILTSSEELNNITTHYYSWPDEKKSQFLSFDNSKSYSYNDDIWILVNTSLRVLDVPISGLTQYCNSKTNLRYLVNFQSKCLSALPNVDMYDVYNQSNALFLISSPSAFNETWIKSSKDCPMNVCIPMLVHVCDMQSCVLLNSTEERPFPSCRENYCTNMITSVRFDFYTNGSTGFTNASVFFGLSDMILTSKYVQQDFQISQAFINRNVSEAARPLSGSLGYKPGKPIIISKMIGYKENNDSEEIEMLEYFSSKSLYPLRNLLSTPKNLNGFCVLSNVSYEEIRFQENIKLSCQTVQNISEHIVKENATAACISIQYQLIKFMPYKLISEYPKLYVSTAGNPTPDSKTWIELMLEVTPGAVGGAFGEDQTSLTCFNVKSKVIYSFVYAADQHPIAGNQMNMVGAEVRYAAPDGSTFAIKDNLVVATLSVSTRFVDITKPQSPIYARGPSFHINLPADFFYPFSFNAGSRNHINHINFIFCLVLNVLKRP